MPPIKGQMFRYSVEDMYAAIEDVKRGMPVAASAKTHNVPRTTLLYKVTGKTPNHRQMGRESYLTKDQENLLVKWIQSVSRAGFPVSKNQLLDSVRKIVLELNIVTPFKDGRPGKRWLKSFLKRHTNVAIRTSQNLTCTRASVTKEKLDNWFGEVFKYLQEEGFDEILKDPERIFNADETAFFLNPKGSKVLAMKGDKNVYQQVNPDEKECLTVLFSGSAAGKIVSPMVIFKYERIPKEICLSVPNTWGLGRSESGWMTGETFYEFITNIFNTWLEQNNIPKPVILFIDGHTSHLTQHVSHFCSHNGIVLVALYPNATHLIQPMDVAVFRSLKGAWKDAVRQWRIDNINSPFLRKVNFCPLLEKVVKDTLNASIFQNGFRKCGIYPWNKDAISFVSSDLTNSNTSLILSNPTKELTAGIAFVEKHMDQTMLNSFKNDFYNPEDESFYRFYKKITSLETKLNESDVLSESVNVAKNEDKCSKYITVPPSTSKLHSNSNNITPTKASSSVINENIPTPFKKALFWPEQKQIVKKRKTDKVPAVISSLQWQKYYENKEIKKKNLIEEKNKRAEERKKKKEMKEMMKTQKKDNKRKRKVKTKRPKDSSSSSDEYEEWADSGDSIDDIVSDEENAYIDLLEKGEGGLPNKEYDNKVQPFRTTQIEHVDIKGKGIGKKTFPTKKMEETTNKIFLRSQEVSKIIQSCNECGVDTAVMKIKCMVCQNLSCASCSGDYNCFDYICQKCLLDSGD